MENLYGGNIPDDEELVALRSARASIHLAWDSWANANDLVDEVTVLMESLRLINEGQ